MSQRLRLVYTTSARIPSRAANAVQSLKMCDAFAGLGHDVVMHCRAGDPLDVVNDFSLRHRFHFEPIQPVDIRGLRTAVFEAQMMRLATRRPLPDLYFSRDVYSVCALAPFGVPIVLELHRTMEGHSVEELALRWLMPQPALRAVVVVSEGMARWYAEHFPGLRLVVEPGAAEEPVAGVARPLGRPGALKLGYFGHLYEGRGVELLAALATRLPDVDVHVFGGTEADLTRCRLKFQSPNLHFHGFVAHAEISSYTASLDVLLAPYQRRVVVEGGAETSAVMSPLKIFEYMALGRPMICSDLPVLREVLNDDIAALVSPDDIDAWIAAVDRFRDRGLRARIGGAAHDRFVARHTWSGRARRLVTVGVGA
jgi:glycosyltransferase involved in cell wall biosynthesis